MKTCESCLYYRVCESEECPKDKDPHGHCYVSPPMTVRRASVPRAADPYWVDIENHGGSEVFADRIACRFWDEE